MMISMSRILFASEINGLNYRVFQPDGFCYSVLAGKYSGMNIVEISQLLDTVYPESVMGLDSSSCESLKGRFLYPFLSVPFFKMFGSIGMLFVPVVCFILFIYLTLLSLKRLKVSLTIQFTIMSLMISSLTVSRWFISNLTDPLLYALSSYLFFRLIFYSHLESRIQYLHLIPVVTAMSLTKRSLHVVAITGALLMLILMLKSSLIFMHAIKRWHKGIHISLCFFIYPLFLDRLFATLFQPQNTLAISRVLDDTAPPEILVQVISYLISTLGQVFAMDWPLTILICLWLFTAVAALRNFNLLTALGFIGPILITLTSSLHMTLGLNLRFELSFLFPMILLLGKSLSATVEEKNQS